MVRPPSRFSEDRFPSTHHRAHRLHGPISFHIAFIPFGEYGRTVTNGRSPRVWWCHATSAWLLRFIGCVWRLSTQKGQRLTGGVASHFQRILSNGGQIRRLCDVGIIEPYDGDIFRNMQLLLAEFLDDCDCHLIGFGTDGVGMCGNDSNFATSCAARSAFDNGASCSSAVMT